MFPDLLFVIMPWLCVAVYIVLNITIWKQLKIAYRPRESFNLRDFHHAVNHLPSDAFLPQINDSDSLCHPGGSSLSLSLSLSLPTII
jgi:hypothetical protein